MRVIVVAGEGDGRIAWDSRRCEHRRDQEERSKGQTSEDEEDEEENSKPLSIARRPLHGDSIEEEAHKDGSDDGHQGRYEGDKTNVMEREAELLHVRRQKGIHVNESCVCEGNG